MEIAEHLATLVHDGHRLAAAAEIAGLDAPVPTCPDWRVRDLVRHVAGVHRWAASYVTTGNQQPPRDERQFELAREQPDSDLIGWFREGHAALLTALAEADPELSCWAFLPAPSALAFWARRQAHETAIHRVDAEAAAGAVTGCAADAATDGIDELLTCFYGRPGGRLLADPPVTLAVHTTDTDTAWALRIGPDRRVTTPGAREGDCVVAGPASDVYLMLWNRRDRSGLDVTGDAAVLDLWRAKARVHWS